MIHIINDEGNAGFLPGPLRIFSFASKTTADLSPSFHPHSLLSMFCSVPVGRFSFQWVLPPVSRSLVFRITDQEPELSRSHPNSAILLVCILSIRADSDYAARAAIWRLFQSGS